MRIFIFLFAALIDDDFTRLTRFEIPTKVSRLLHVIFAPVWITVQEIKRTAAHYFNSRKILKIKEGLSDVQYFT